MHRSYWILRAIWFDFIGYCYHPWGEKTQDLSFGTDLIIISNKTTKRSMPYMKATNNVLSEYVRIIRQFIKMPCRRGGCRLCTAQAVEAITPAAEHGDVKAQMLLGQYYSWGYHNECDNRKAIHWFEKAADNGNAEAAMPIMEIYRNDCPDWHRGRATKGVDLEMAQTLARYIGNKRPTRFG